jgi:hypothetical protein
LLALVWEDKMTNDGWGSKWPAAPIFPQQLIDEAKREEKEYTDVYGTEVNPVALGVKPEAFQTEASTFIYTTKDDPWPITGHVVCDVDKDGNIDLTPLRDKLIGWDLAKPNSDKTILNKEGWQTELKSQGSNLVDEQAYLYFQCESCNEILDPHTKSFKALEEARFKAGWKVKWNIDGMGYKVYCVKCNNTGD